MKNIHHVNDLFFLFFNAHKTQTRRHDPRMIKIQSDLVSFENDENEERNCVKGKD